MKLTVKSTLALELPPGKSDHVFWDDELPGLGARFRAGGSKTWIYQFAIGDKQRRMTLGRVTKESFTTVRDRDGTVREARHPRAGRAPSRAGEARRGPRVGQGRGSATGRRNLRGRVKEVPRLPEAGSCGLAAIGRSSATSCAMPANSTRIGLQRSIGAGSPPLSRTSWMKSGTVTANRVGSTLSLFLQVGDGARASPRSIR